MSVHSQHVVHALPQQLDLLIFGGMGDLSLRKLLPALYMAHRHGNLPEQTRVVLLGRSALSRPDLLSQLQSQCWPLIAIGNQDPAAWQRFLSVLQYQQLDATDVCQYAALACVLRPDAVRVYYLATAPQLFTPICQHLAANGLVHAQSRVVLEKPLGFDLVSAQAIHEQVGSVFAEEQIYRIDHYLGKETVQNLMVLRFGNGLFEPLWRGPHIRSVQITVAETVGVGSRAGFYDGTGALRDMVQNHLLQLLCIVAMEPPTSLQANAIRDEKLKVLNSLRVMSPTDVAQNSVRGQYTAGRIADAPVTGYLQEQGVPLRSQTETFVALRAHIDNWRWANVPFFLRTGKRLPHRYSEIVIDFAEPPVNLFHTSHNAPVNRLFIRLQPQESIQLQMMAKKPGSGMYLRPVSLNLDLEEAMVERRAEAYERLLMDVIRGRLTHFMRRDELEAAWRWIDPISQAWQAQPSAPVPYAAGTWGPAQATQQLMANMVGVPGWINQG
jgi:glucose-6-phosphate 1-dehydrogenase